MLIRFLCSDYLHFMLFFFLFPYLSFPDDLNINVVMLAILKKVCHHTNSRTKVYRWYRNCFEDESMKIHISRVLSMNVLSVSRRGVSVAPSHLTNKMYTAIIAPIVDNGR